jgi:hypothetical protein
LPSQSLVLSHRYTGLQPDVIGRLEGKTDQRSQYIPIGLSMIRDLIQEGGKVLHTQIIPQGMPTLSTSPLEAKHILYWLEKGRYLVCSTQKKQSKTIYACPKCNMACHVSRFTIQNPSFDTNKYWEKRITHLVSMTSIMY